MSAVRAAAACAGRTALAFDSSSPLRLRLARPSACPACRWTQRHAAVAARHQGFHVLSASCALSRFRMPAMSPTMTEGGIMNWRKAIGFHVLSASCALSRFRMPAMSPTMTEGGIMNWRKAEGEAFSAGDILLEIETDKAQIEVEAQDDGILAKILIPAGTGKKIAVNDPIAIIAEDESDVSQAHSAAMADEERREPAESKPAAAENKMAEAGLQPKFETGGAGSNAHTVPTATVRFPAVARLVAEYGVDVSAVKASGPKGDVLKGDVLKFIKEGNLVKKTQEAKNIRAQKGQTSQASFATAKAKSTLPRFIITRDVIAPAVRDDPNATLIYAVSRAVRSVPQVNIRRVRNPSFSEDAVEDSLAASEFVAQLGPEAAADVDVMFRKDGTAGTLDGVLFRNVDKATANAKEPITMDFLGQCKEKGEVKACCAVSVTPASSGIYDFSLSSTAVEPTIVNIARSPAIRTSLPSSSADIFDILSPRPRLPSALVLTRSCADEIDMLLKHSPVSKTALSAAVPKYTLSFSFDATLIDPVVADEFCDAVTQELAGRT